MNKAVRTVFIVVIQAAYVAFVVLAIGYFFDYLPKILNSLLLLFVMPAVVAALLGKIIGFLFKHFISSGYVFMMLMITSTTVWLPGIYPGLFMVKDYLNLSKRPVVEFASVYDYNRHRDAGFVEYADGQPAEQFHAVRITTSRVKSGDSYTTVTHYSHVTPVLPQDYETGDPVRVWLVGGKEKAPSLTGQSLENGIIGMVVHDPYETSKYRKAVKIAENKHPVISVENPVFVEPTLLRYSLILAQKKRYAYWSLGAAVFLWTLPVLILGIRSQNGELEAESPYEAVLDSEEVQTSINILQEDINVNSDDDLADVLLDHEDPKKRIAAATLLGHHGGPHPIRTLFKALFSDPAPKVRKSVAWSLGYPVCLGMVKTSAEFIAAYNAESDENIRYVIALQIGQVAERWNDVSAVTFLMDSLPNETSASVRSVMMEQIGRAGGEPAIDVAARVLREDDYDMVRERACMALGEIGGEDAERILTETRKNDKSEFVRAAAKKALKELRANRNQHVD